jgi:hypothetical protein
MVHARRDTTATPVTSLMTGYETFGQHDLYRQADTIGPIILMLSKPRGRLGVHVSARAVLGQLSPH